MSEEIIKASRVLMGDSLGFHIIFVAFGLTLPVIVSWFEWLAIRRKDEKLMQTAKFLSKIMAFLVITGVISGTIIALQMSLVWPGILKFGGEVIGLPFLFETYAFLIEAVFLALYMVTWNRKKMPQRVHWVIGLFVVLGSTLSAYAITSVNGWMNNPTGFDYVDGKLTNINVFEAMFSRVSLVEFFHSMPGYYLSVALFVAGIYAFKLLRMKKGERRQTEGKFTLSIIKRLAIFAAVMFVLSGITADITGKYLAEHEPVKLAAIELNYDTQDNAPLLIGGVPSGEGEIAGPHIKIPGALSFLAGNSTDTVVKGLEEFPKEEQPPLYVHTLFDIKMTIITYLAVFFVGLFAVWKLRPQWMLKRWFLLTIGVTGFLPLMIVELGWMMTEIGRQPWAVRGFVRTGEAVTQTHDISSFGYIFPILYVILFVLTILGVRKIVRDNANGVKK